MDFIISRYPSVPFGELNYCRKHGVAYQRDMSVSVDYGESYFDHYVKIENSDIALRLNAGRTALTERHCRSLLDVGVGSGEFIRSSKLRTLGYDINPVAVRWLREDGIWHDPYESVPDVDGYCFWDTLEHIPEPHTILGLIPAGRKLFVSMPVFTDLTLVRESKHYKPNEHYYYFTTDGLVNWLGEHGFELLELSDLESRAGRERIMTLVLERRSAP